MTAAVATRFRVPAVVAHEGEAVPQYVLFADGGACQPRYPGLLTAKVTQSL